MDDLERRLKELGERTAEGVRHGEVPRARIVRRARLRRGLVVGAPVVAAVVVAALVFPRLDVPGRDGTGEGRVVELAAVASATEGAGTARLQLEMSFDSGEGAQTTRGTGVIDFANVRSRIILEQTGFTQRMEIVSVGSSVFMRVLDPTGAQWHQIEMPDGGAASPALGGDPSDLLSSLKGDSHDVIDLGDETLDGDRVTHYRAEMETPSFGATMPEGMEFEVEPMDVWVDEEGRLRRLTFGASGDGIGSTHMDMRLRDFGVPVEIEAPDPDDVSDEPSPYAGESSIGNEIGSGGAVTMIMGEGRIDAPYVEVDTQDPRIIEACVHSPRPVTSARLVHDPSGRLVFVFSPVRSDGHFSGPLPVACVEHPIAPTDVEALIEEPTEFRLDVERANGSSEVVELTTTASSRGNSTAVE